MRKMSCLAEEQQHHTTACRAGARELLALMQTVKALLEGRCRGSGGAGRRFS